MKAAASARRAGSAPRRRRADGKAGLERDLLDELSQAMRDASICGLGQAAPEPADLGHQIFP